MKLFLQVLDNVDIYYFHSSSIQDRTIIDLSSLQNSNNVLRFFQSSLQKNSYVLILMNLNNELPNLTQLKANHFKIEKDNFIFLNYSLKKQILKINSSEVIFENYQTLEQFLQEKLSTIF